MFCPSLKTGMTMSSSNALMARPRDFSTRSRRPRQAANAVRALQSH